MTGLTPEQIADIAVKAALAAVASATGSAPAPVDASPDDTGDEADDREIASQQAKQAETQHRIDELTEELIPLLFADRHKAVFDWLVRGSGGSAGRLVQVIIRSEISRRMPDYREAQGGGGSSSRNIETLTERLPVHK